MNTLSGQPATTREVVIQDCAAIAAKSITDEEYAILIKRYGTAKTIAEELVRRCAENYDAEQAKKNSTPWLAIIASIAGISVVGAIAYSVGKDNKSSSSSY